MKMLDVYTDPFPAWREDAGWVNTVTSFGTSRDKTMYGRPMPVCPLAFQTLDDLYNGNDIAARMIDVPPEESMRKGYTALADEESVDDVEGYTALLELHDVHNKIVEADCWGRLYGRGSIIMYVNDGQTFDKPLQIERVRGLDSLVVVDRRWLTPASFYRDGPKAGLPDVYSLHRPSGLAEQSLLIHDTRMVLFGGARTSWLDFVQLNYSDYSVLQRCTDQLRGFETAFKSAELMLTEGPQSAYGIKDLPSYIGTIGEKKLQNRIAMIEQARSMLNALVYDKDNEAWERKPMAFTGIDDLLDKFMLRIAASVRIPVTILMGQSPAGMNATGDSDFRWFYDQIATRQRNMLAPRVQYLIRVMLASLGKQPKKVEVEFHKLWTPTEKEAAEIEKSKADTAAVYIDKQVVTPEEYATSPCFDADDWGIDDDGLAAREALVKATLEASKPPAPVEPEADPAHPPEEQDPNAPPPAPGAPKLAPAPAAPLGIGAKPAAPTTEDVQKTALNGAQVAALVSIVTEVAAGTIPRDSAIQIIVLSFPVTAAQAELIVGSAGTPKFEPTKPEPPANAFGAPPNPDDPAPPKARPKPPPFGGKPPSK